MADREVSRTPTLRKKLDTIERRVVTPVVVMTAVASLANLGVAAKSAIEGKFSRQSSTMISKVKDRGPANHTPVTIPIRR